MMLEALRPTPWGRTVESRSKGRMYSGLLLSSDGELRSQFFRRRHILQRHIVG
jgi:hypothetical protein